jgi:hypothetical protein
MKYKVTTKLDTPWWKRLLRWLRLSEPIEEFEIEFTEDYFSIGDILDATNCKVKIIGRVSAKNS